MHHQDSEHLGHEFHELGVEWLGNGAPALGVNVERRTFPCVEYIWTTVGQWGLLGIATTTGLHNTGSVLDVRETRWDEDDTGAA